MTTEVTCAGCGAVLERYDDDEPLVEVPEGLCPKCFNDDDAFDRALEAHETGGVPAEFDDLEDDDGYPDDDASEDRYGF